MINYRSLTESLAKRGFIRSNACTFDGKVYHDFTNRKTRETASATVDNNKVNMEPDGNSANAFVPFTVINTRGFDLPQTGSYGNWMFPVIGLSMLTLCVAGIVALTRKSKKKALNT